MQIFYYLAVVRNISRLSSKQTMNTTNDYDFFLNDPDITQTAEPETLYTLNRDLSLAQRIIEQTDTNLFLTGKAGTGKTTFLRHLCQTSDKRMIVLAPTGVAAINARGVTIHSFFQLSFSPWIPGRGFAKEERRFFKLNATKRKLISSLDLIVIDEISMVRPDTLDAIDEIMRRHKDPRLPFGGAQLLLIGDLRQLAPVVREEEWKLLAPYYASPYFFESKALTEAGFVTVELSAIFRQSDREFIRLLNEVREGTAGKETLSILNRRVNSGFIPPEGKKYIRLTTHNRIANNINDSRLQTISEPEYVYNAEISGNFPESSYPAEKTLVLKKGAQVMFVKNDAGTERQFFNGMLGVITDLDASTVTVLPDSAEEPITIGALVWENTGYSIDEETQEIRQTIEGTFRQIPLRTAWAITIHKSQGLTFSYAIIDTAAAFAPGQAYVALSRCRSLEGMVLDSPIPGNAIIIDRKVNDFLDFQNSNRPGEAALAEMQTRYIKSLLSDLFNFHLLKAAFDDFRRAVDEFLAPLYTELYTEYSRMAEKIKEEIVEVADRFSNRYFSTISDSKKFDTDSTLKERIMKGCAYFIDHINDIDLLLKNTPKSLSNKTYMKRLQNSYENLTHLLAIKKFICMEMQSCPFTVADYLKIKAKAVLNADDYYKSLTEQKAKPKNVKIRKEKKEKKPKGYSVAESVKMFKEGKTIEEIAIDRNLAVNTIITHIAQAISDNRLSLEMAVDNESIQKFSEIRDLNPDLTLYEVAKLAENEIDPTAAHLLAKIKH